MKGNFLLSFRGRKHYGKQAGGGEHKEPPEQTFAPLGGRIYETWPPANLRGIFWEKHDTGIFSAVGFSLAFPVRCDTRFQTKIFSQMFGTGFSLRFDAGIFVGRRFQPNIFSPIWFKEA